MAITYKVLPVVIICIDVSLIVVLKMNGASQQ